MTSTQWLEVLASYSLQVVAVVFVGRFLERRSQTSEDRCLVWNACFFSILVLGLASLVLPRFHVIQPWLVLDPHRLLAVGSVETVIGRLLVMVWATGAALAMMKLIAREILLRRTLKRCAQLNEHKTSELLSGIRSGSAMRKMPTILISEDNHGPCCWQFQRPTILLPRFILDGPQDDLRHVLVHEVEHLRTNHPLHLFLQHVVQIVCWFHPAVWTAACYASLAREYVCDDAAAEGGKSSAAYLRTLLRITERQRDTDRKLQSIGFSRSRSEIILRAQRLAQCSSSRRSRNRRRSFGKKTVLSATLFLTCVLSQLSLPLDAMSSSRTRWTPWPTWTSQAGHIFGLRLRDYEQFDRRTRAYEQHYENGEI